MFKLSELVVRNLRGVRDERALAINPKGACIAGPNGSGKSSILDALDFLFTGQVHRLKGEGFSGVTLEKHGAHILSDPTDAWVEASFTWQAENRTRAEVKLRRTVAAADDLSGLDAAPPALASFVDVAARSRHHMLSRREILRLIVTSPGSRQEQVAALLAIERVDEVRKTLTTAARQAREHAAEAASALELLERKARASVSPAAANDAALLAAVNLRRNRLGAPPLDVLTAVKEGVTFHDEACDPFAGLAVRRDTAGATTWFEEQLPAWQEAAEAFQVRLAELHRAGAIVRPLSDLLQHALDQLEGDDCPVCATSFDPGLLRAQIQERLAAAKERERGLQELDDERKRLLRLAGQLSGSVSSLATELEHHDLGTRAAAAATAVDKGVLALLPDVWSAQAAAAEPTDSLAPALERLKEAVAAIAATVARAQTPRLDLAAWDELTAVAAVLADLEPARIARSRAEQSASVTAEADRAFAAARDRVLSETYAAVEHRVNALYRRIHGHDETAFGAHFNAKKTGLELAVGFHGKGDYPPAALHSEGHQDTLGICLFLALSEHLAGGKPPLLLLDDVLMSVDRDHRRGVAEMLADEYGETQLIVTTHDHAWASQLWKLGVTARPIELAPWALDTPFAVPVTARSSFEAARQRLTAGDAAGAAAALRRGCESMLPDICDALAASVRFRSDGRYELGDYLNGAKAALGDRIKQARNSASSWKRPSDKVDALSARRDAAWKAIEKEGWVVNTAVHFNAKMPDLGSADIAPAIAAYQTFFEAFSCPSCSGYLSLSWQATTETLLGCPCGEISLTLQTKPKQ